MNTNVFSLSDYIIQAAPFYLVVAGCYFVSVVVSSRGADPINWRTSLGVALLISSFHALSNSKTYAYLNLPKLPLPTPEISSFRLFVVTFLGILVVLSVTNLLTQLIFGIFASGSRSPKPSVSARPLVSLPVVSDTEEAKKRSSQSLKTQQRPR